MTHRLKSALWVPLRCSVLVAVPTGTYRYFKVLRPTLRRLYLSERSRSTCTFRFMAVLAKVESKSQSPKVENMFSKLNLSETFFLPHLNFPIYRLTETCDSTSAIETETWILPLRYGVYTFGFSELVLLKATSLGPEPVWTFVRDQGTCTVMST